MQSSQPAEDTSLRTSPAGSTSSASEQLRQDQAGVLKAALKKKNWSQREAARRFGLAPSTVNRAVNGLIPLTDGILREAERVKLLTPEQVQDLRMARLRA